MKTKQKPNNLEGGITLIALVVMIILLVILAAVVVRGISGQDGILRKYNKCSTKILYRRI